MVGLLSSNKRDPEVLMNRILRAKNLLVTNKIPKTKNADMSGRFMNAGASLVSGLFGSPQLSIQVINLSFEQKYLVLVGQIFVRDICVQMFVAFIVQFGLCFGCRRLIRKSQLTQWIWI